jgi:hypothetical protein
MNDDSNIDPDVFAAYVRDAERLRAEALRQLLGSWWSALVRLGMRARTLVRPGGRRRKLNLAVPAPHH